MNSQIGDLEDALLYFTLRERERYRLFSDIRVEQS